MEAESSSENDQIENLNTLEDSDRLLRLDPRHDFQFCIDCDKNDQGRESLVQFRANFERCLEKSFTYRTSII